MSETSVLELRSPAPAPSRPARVRYLRKRTPVRTDRIPRRTEEEPIRPGSRVIRGVEALIFPAAALFLWWLAAREAWMPANILPSPATVWQSLRDMISDGDLASNLGMSLQRVVKGFLIGGLIGLALGLAMGFSPAIDEWVGPAFRLIAQVPWIAYIPLLMYLLGIDEGLKLFIMAKACAVPIAFTTSDGIRNIPVQYIEVGKVLRLSRRTVIGKIILPGALPSIFTGVRQGLSHVWISLVAVEILASSNGIGYLMAWGRLIFQLDVVMVCIVIVGVVGFLLDFGLKHLEARLLRHWGSAA